jgi:hypothetical protein
MCSAQRGNTAYVTHTQAVISFIIDLPGTVYCQGSHTKSALGDAAPTLDPKRSNSGTDTLASNASRTVATSANSAACRRPGCPVTTGCPSSSLP